MSRRPSPAPSAPARASWWLAALAAALLFLGLDTARQLADHADARHLIEAGRPAPARHEASATGYAFGQRNRLLASTDGYHWVMQTQQMLADDELRVRHVDYDNAPAGRDVHWSTPPRAWLAAVALSDHTLTGLPLPLAVERAAWYAGPLLLALLLLALTPLLARALGPAPAALFALGLVCLAPLKGEFGAGSFDHHGLAAVCALLGALGLAWPDPRRGVTVSAVAIAVGLWLNAATELPLLVATGVAALLVGGAGLPWRRWGLIGAGSSLAFYLLEYLPFHVSWRLEVNHPLYALAWLGGADLLARAQAWRTEHAGFRTARDRLLAGLSAVAGLAPAAVVLGWPATFVVRDPLLWALHVDYIQEFGPLWDRFAGATPGGVLRLLLVNAPLLPLAGALLLLLAPAWRHLPPSARARLALALAPALAATALTLNQERWLPVATALGLGALLAGLALLPATPRGARRPALLAALALLFLSYPVDAFAAWLRPRTGLTSAELRQAVVRDLAFWLRRCTGDAPVTVASGPTVTTELVYHGGFHGVGTLYWENLAGLRDLVAIYGARSPADALAGLRAHGVTHMVVFSRGSFAAEAARLARGLRRDAPVPRDAFLVSLLDGGRLPDWVRPLTYRLPDHPAFRDEIVFVLEVAPDQTSADATVRRAQFLTTYGNVADARALLDEVLARAPDHVPALIALASLHRGAGQRPPHQAVMQRLRPLLAADPALEPGDRLQLALELAADRRPAEARAELDRVWREADPAGLRRLPPELLKLLLDLTRDWRLAEQVPAGRLAFATALLAEDYPAQPAR